MASSISSLAPDEISLYEKKDAELTDKVAEEAQKIRQKFMGESGARMKERNKNLAEGNAANIINRAIDDYELCGQFTILLETGEEVTVHSILLIIRKHHYAACTHPLDQSIFGKSIIYSDQDKPVIHTFAHGGEVFFLRSNYEERELADWEIELNNFVMEFNKTHAQVMIGGKHRIMKTIPADAHYESRVSYEFFDQAELKKINANKQIQVGEKNIRGAIVPVRKNIVTAWAEHENCAIYREGVRFASGMNLPNGYFNTWQGFAIEPLKGANRKKSY